MKTIGEFYREKVLSLPKNRLVKRKLPDGSDGIKIYKDLFGWKLLSGKKVFDVRSEEEGRYLGIFIDLGLMEVYVPKDDRYMSSILPELERLKTRTDEILNSYLATILDRKIREQLKHEVYIEVTK